MVGTERQTASSTTKTIDIDRIIEQLNLMKLEVLAQKIRAAEECAEAASTYIIEGKFDSARGRLKHLDDLRDSIIALSRRHPVIKSSSLLKDQIELYVKHLKLFYKRKFREMKLARRQQAVANKARAVVDTSTKASSGGDSSTGSVLKYVLIALLIAGLAAAAWFLYVYFTR